MPDRFVLVLAGGQGERFWPWSRPERPKQLLPLARGGRSLLEATLDRALALAPPERIVVLTSIGLKRPVGDACAGTRVRVIGEPVMRNTAAAIGAAAVLFRGQASDPAFAVLPADHAIEDLASFVEDLGRAFDRAETGEDIVTIGIRPTGPETHFGYIRRGAPIAERLVRVDGFTEKPDRARAQAWFKSGDYAWNSGIFVWRSSTLLDGLKRGRPALAAAINGLTWKGSDEAFERDLERVFPQVESISVDYAVLEGAPNVVMIEAAFDWDDLGSWSAWARRQPRDPDGNVLHGDAIAIDCKGCVVVGEDGKAAAMGLRDMVVVRASGATLVCRLEDSDEVRRVAWASRDEVAR